MKITLLILTSLTVAALIFSVIGFFNVIDVFAVKILFMICTGVQIFTLSILWAVSSQELKSRRRLESNLIFHEPTGLTNRNGTVKNLSAGVTSAHRHKYPFGLILVGLDRFREINNQLGQRGGDVILKQVGEFLQAEVREEDMLGHFEGDIFLVGTAHTDLEGTRVLARRIQDKILAHMFKAKGGVARISVSQGVVCSPPDGFDHENMILNAIERLKSAKEAGGNTIVGPS